MKLILAVITLSICSISANDELWMDLMSAGIMGTLTEEMEAGLKADKGIVDLASDLGLNTLVTLVKKADLAGALSSAGKQLSHVLWNTCFSELDASGCPNG